MKSVKVVTNYQINKISKGIILSLEDFMDNCSVSLAKSMVKFWFCTGPNPLFVKSKNKYINYPKKLSAPYEDISKRLHSQELINLVQNSGGMQAEYNVMYKVYAHFYKDYKEKGGCICGGGFLLNLFQAKIKGQKKAIKSW